jgi:hypothetical protein
MTFEDYCRWANKGYRDGQPGTERDVQERVRRLEANCQSYARSLARILAEPRP